MRERLIRVFIIVFLALVVVALAKSLADWQNQANVAGASISLPNLSLQRKLEDLGGKILGQAIKILPGAPQLEIEIQEGEDIEPIKEPMTNIQEQTDNLIKAIKKLPEDQLEATKKQIRKEFCEGVLGEEE
ncbi:MAG TPA: hypothetical protein VMY36_01665 [Patescibacteria group bacterium]|nr:hypothetical protein [Patescibacteria group bacterium]